jgi:dihydropteroate synthase
MYYEEISSLRMDWHDKMCFRMVNRMGKIALKKWREERGGKGPGVTSCGGKTFRWGERTYVMGIVNVSPDSFSGDGLDNVDDAVAQAHRFVSEGVDMIDVGGESTRPGTAPESTQSAIERELSRIMPVLERLCGRIDVPLSVDTYRYEVARRALDIGVNMINDIWGLRQSPELAGLAAERGVPIIMMSNQRDGGYTRIMPAIIADLKRAIDTALDAGVPWENTIIDPGIGFGKTLEQNYEIVRRLDELKALGRPVLLGTSRKSMIGLTLDVPADQRLEGTAATVAIGIANGADIIRVHDVREMIRVCRMSDAIIRTRRG